MHVIGSLDRGGAEMALARLCEYGPASGVRNIVVSLTDAGPLAADIERAGARVEALGLKSLVNAPLAIARLRRLICEIEPDVVQSWMYHASALSALARPSAPLLWNIRHSVYDLRDEKPLTRMVIGLCRVLSHCPARIVYNARTSARQHADLGFDATGSIIIPNGIDTSALRPDTDAGNAFRRQLALDDGIILVGLVGRFHPMKDHGNFVAAAAIIARRHPEVRFLLAGRDADSANQDLKDLLADAGIGDRFFCLGERTDIPALNNALDIACSASFSEAFSTSIAEAMACGVPCVATDVGDSAYLLGASGLIVPPRAPEDLAAALMQLIKAGEAERRRIGAEGRRRIAGYFSMEKNAAAYRSLYDQLLGNPQEGPRTLLFVINNAAFFLSHRLAVARAAKDAGFRVCVAAPVPDQDVRVRLEGEGIEYLPVRLSRSGANPFRELASCRELYRLFRRLQPDIVHNITIKPVLYGTMAARWARVPRVINAISGMGYVFTAQGLLGRLRRAIVRRLYRLAMRHPGMCVIFQNVDDKREFMEAGLVQEDETEIIEGSGVDLAEFAPSVAIGKPGRELRVLLAARLLADKGIREFVEAARLVRAAGVALDFTVAGQFDRGNPSAISEQEMADWDSEGLVEHLGHVNDMAKLLAESDIACLPSYREGLSKSLLEAAAAGLPIVTTNVPGCRDVVEDGRNGLLVPPRDAPALAKALTLLAADGDLRRAMGAQSRRVAEARFGIGPVIEKHLALYGDPNRAKTR